MKASEVEGFQINDRDIISITESIIARGQGNYATVDAIATDVRSKFAGDTVGVVFPILSRNRFSNCLHGIAKGVQKVVLMLSRSEEHTSELQSRGHLVCSLLLEKK